MIFISIKKGKIIHIYSIKRKNNYKNFNFFFFLNTENINKIKFINYFTQFGKCSLFGFSKFNFNSYLLINSIFAKIYFLFFNSIAPFLKFISSDYSYK